MPRFVVLIHNHPHLHWDFLLECDGKLRAWRLDHPPDADVPISADPLPDHRLQYLDYEGPVSGNRGEVYRWDRGEYDLIDESPQRLEVRLKGTKITGRAAIIVDPSAQLARFEFVPD